MVTCDDIVTWCHGAMVRQLVHCNQARVNIPRAALVLQVRDPTVDKEMGQASLCKGWNDWRKQMETESQWRDAVDRMFSGAAGLVHGFAPGEVVAHSWPDDKVTMTANTTDPDFNMIAFMEEVRCLCSRALRQLRQDHLLAN